MRIVPFCTVTWVPAWRPPVAVIRISSGEVSARTAWRCSIGGTGRSQEMLTSSPENWPLAAVTVGSPPGGTLSSTSAWPPRTVPAVMLVVIQSRASAPAPRGQYRGRSATASWSKPSARCAATGPSGVRRAVPLASITGPGRPPCVPSGPTREIRRRRSAAVVPSASIASAAEAIGTALPATSTVPAPIFPSKLPRRKRRAGPSVRLAVPSIGASIAFNGSSAGAASARDAGASRETRACTVASSPPAGRTAVAVILAVLSPSASVTSPVPSTPPPGRRRRSSVASRPRQVAPSWRSSTTTRACAMRTWTSWLQRMLPGASGGRGASLAGGAPNWVSSVLNGFVSPAGGVATGAVAGSSIPRSSEAAPAGSRTIRRVAPSRPIARGTMRPRSSQPNDSEISACGICAIGGCPGRAAVTPATRMSSG